jgi:hypothetical protein
MFHPGGRYADQRPAVPLLDANQAGVARLFPDGKPRAGSAPGIHRFFIRSILAGEPLEQIRDKNFDG